MAGRSGKTLPDLYLVSHISRVWHAAFSWYPLIVSVRELIRRVSDHMRISNSTPETLL